MLYVKNKCEIEYIIDVFLNIFIEIKLLKKMDMRVDRGLYLARKEKGLNILTTLNITSDLLFKVFQNKNKGENNR